MQTQPFTDTIEFQLNGQIVQVDGLSTNLTLLQFLRDRGLTGAKEGCAEGDCGACSVGLYERDAGGETRLRAVNSCLLLLPTVNGRRIVTVEGLKPKTADDLHPVQKALVNHYGSQCGYCTPGIVMSMLEAYHRTDLTSEAKLAEQLAGNLCRCTGYRSIRDAARALLKTERSPDQQFAHEQCDLREPANYAANGEFFLYPSSLEELFSFWNTFPAAQLAAGLTELGLAVTKRYDRLPQLISLTRIPELQVLTETESAWQVGAAVSLTNLEDSLGPEFPALAEMLRWFGSRQIRNRATLGGNLVTASPIGDCAPVLLALDARLKLTSAKDSRELPMADFFTEYRKTALRGGEILEAVIIPRRATESFLTREEVRFDKVSRRREMDISTISACFRIGCDASGEVVLARLAYGGVASKPTRALRTEAALLGKAWTADLLRDSLKVLETEFEPITDVRGTAEYRRALVLALWERFGTSDATRIPMEESIDIRPPGLLSPGTPAHESAHRHVTGSAVYVDDMVECRTALHGWPVCSKYSRAKLVRVDPKPAERITGVQCVLLAADVPGINNTGSVRPDEPLLADTEVHHHGQIIALVVAETEEIARTAAEAVEVEYSPLEPILTIAEARAKDSFHTHPNYIRRGAIDSALAEAECRLAGEFELGAQDHFYLETQVALALPDGNDGLHIYSSTQHPSEAQHMVAQVLNWPANRIVVECPRLGGGFGGKETQAAINASLASLAAHLTGKPTRLRFNRDQDMMITGKRHPFWSRFEAGFDRTGVISALRVELVSDGGWSLDLSMAVTDRAVFHLDNSYYIPNVELSGRVAQTNVTSHTAFRGFGGPQGMLIVEEIMDRIARSLGLPPEDVRQKNLYHGNGETNTTAYGQEIENNRIEQIWHQLRTLSNFDERRAEVQRWNQAHAHAKRGLAMTPVKFGISFTATQFNQAGALVLIYQDGSVQVNHGGIEMGQGIHSNILAIAARELGIHSERVRLMPTRTDKVPNTSATAASSGTDLNGSAVKDACRTLIGRLRPLAAQCLAERSGNPVGPDEVEFCGDQVQARNRSITPMRFGELIQRAYFDRISLSATGYYRTPGISWNRALGKGRPFHYYAVGAAVSEVEVDGWTGIYTLRRTDILHDVGDSINSAINRGQIEGGFIQGVGWLTNEELVWDENGRLLTHSPDTYKIPAFSDVPRIFNVTFLENATQPNNIYGSKAVGEPPLMLAISVREAIREAVAAFGPGKVPVSLRSPATAESIFWAVKQQQRLLARDGT